MKWRNRVSKTKYFCIGINKTGTTSFGKAFQDLGYDLDDQNRAHRLMKSYFERDFKEIGTYCEKLQVFQDSPFSMKHLYVYLDQIFPNSKFILTIRDSPEVWYESLIRFHSKKFGRNKELPTKEDLIKAKRPHGRSPYENIKLRFNTSDDSLYDKETLMNYYTSHQNEVEDYFRLKPGKLLVINLNKSNSYTEFCKFIGAKSSKSDFPWLNKS